MNPDSPSKICSAVLSLNFATNEFRRSRSIHRRPRVRFVIPTKVSLTSHGQIRPLPLSRPRRAQPRRRSAFRAGGAGDRQPGRAHKSPLSGFAVEFAGHREYVAGRRSQAHRLAGLLHARQVLRQAVRAGDELRLPSACSMSAPRCATAKAASRSCSTPRRWPRRSAIRSSARATRSRWPRSTTTSAASSRRATRWTRSCG